MTLPRFVVIKKSEINDPRFIRVRKSDLSVIQKSDYNGPFLRVAPKKTPYIENDETVIGSPRAKFEVERAKKGRRLVHIRCCYNNKYWSRDFNHYLVANGEKAEEDQSKWSCTLFEPIYTDEGVQLRHVSNSSHYLYVNNADVSFKEKNESQKNQFLFTIIDWESLLKLPRFVVIQTYDNKCMCLTSSSDGSVTWTGEEVVSPQAKFELQRSKKGNRLVVHIRSCYNNKYLVLDSEDGSDGSQIVAKVNHPEEDKSAASCTLYNFEAVDVSKAKICQFHSSNSYYLHSDDTSNSYVFKLIDWESLVILPKHVALKGGNGSYLCAYGEDGLKAVCNDIGDRTVGNEIFTNSDGSIRIKLDYSNKFWRGSSNGDIYVDTDDSTTQAKDNDKYKQTLFWPVKVDDNVIALRSLSNNKFCRDLDTGHLCADDPTISKQARLEVQELVLSRKIYNVDFRLSEARIYSQSVLTMATGHIVNKTEETNTVDLRLFYDDTRSSTWDASLSLSLGVSTTFQAGIPYIEGATVNISAEFTGAYEWGKSEVSVTEVETVYRASVPPKHRVKVRLLATKGTCDVPFSYSQRDTLTNGKQIIHEREDGLYTGINCFNFKYETTEEAL